MWWVHGAYRSICRVACQSLVFVLCFDRGEYRAHFLHGNLNKHSALEAFYLLVVVDPIYNTLFAGAVNRIFVV